MAQIENLTIREKFWTQGKHVRKVPLSSADVARRDIVTLFYGGRYLEDLFEYIYKQSKPFQEYCSNRLPLFSARYLLQLYYYHHVLEKKQEEVNKIAEACLFLSLKLVDGNSNSYLISPEALVKYSHTFRYSRKGRVAPELLTDSLTKASRELVSNECEVLRHAHCFLSFQVVVDFLPNISLAVFGDRNHESISKVPVRDAKDRFKKYIRLIYCSAVCVTYEPQLLLASVYYYMLRTFSKSEIGAVNPNWVSDLGYTNQLLHQVVAEWKAVQEAVEQKTPLSTRSPDNILNSSPSRTISADSTSSSCLASPDMNQSPIVSSSLDSPGSTNSRSASGVVPVVMCGFDDLATSPVEPLSSYQPITPVVPVMADVVSLEGIIVNPIQRTPIQPIPSITDTTSGSLSVSLSTTPIVTQPVSMKRSLPPTPIDSVRQDVPPKVQRINGDSYPPLMVVNEEPFLPKSIHANSPPMSNDVNTPITPITPITPCPVVPAVLNSGFNQSRYYETTGRADYEF